MALIEKVNKANLGTDFADYGIDNNYWQNAYSWEPKKAHQFIMEIDGIPAYLIHSSAKPSIENGEITNCFEEKVAEISAIKAQFDTEKELLEAEKAKVEEK